MACGIYLITRKDTSQKYVGQSNNIENRWGEHKRGKDRKNSRIDNAILKHGKDKFILQIITELPNDRKLLYSHEKYWIKFYNTYENKFHYNLTPGGEGVGAGEDNPFHGMHHSEEFKKKMSERMSGEGHYLFGQHLSEETRRKISESQKGEKSHKWGTSLIEKFGGMEFLMGCIKKGKSQFEVEKIIGVSRGQISNYLRGRDTTWNELRIKLTGNKGWSIINDFGGMEFLKNCIKDGKSLKEIAEETGTTHSNVVYYLMVRDYTWTELYKEVTGYDSYSIIDGFGGLEFLKNSIEKGKSQKEVAEEKGISIETIRIYLKKRGYTWKSLRKEVLGSEYYSVIDDFGGLEFLKECIREGKTQKEIAKEFGFSTKSIRKYLKNKGYTWKTLTNEVWGKNYSVIYDFGGLDFLRDCIKEGKNQEDIAKELGLDSTNTLQYYLKKRSHTCKTLANEVGSEHYSVIDDFGGLDFLRDCIKEGKNQEDIAKEFGFSTKSIRKYLKNRGYTWKSLRKEVLGSEHYSVIDDFGGMEFLKKCIRERKTRKDVAEELGFKNASNISYYLEKRGYTWKSLRKEVLGSEHYSVIDDFGGLDFLRDCIKEGKNQEDIAKELGLDSTSAIRYYLKNNGYTWAQFKEEITGSKQYSIDDFGGLEFLKECIRKRKTQEDITKELGLGINSIRNYLKKKGYTWKQLKKEVNAE